MWCITPTSIYPITEGKEGEIEKEVVFKEISAEMLISWNFRQCGWECTLVQLTWKAVWQ